MKTTEPWTAPEHSLAPLLDCTVLSPHRGGGISLDETEERRWAGLAAAFEFRDIDGFVVFTTRVGRPGNRTACKDKPRVIGQARARTVHEGVFTRTAWPNDKKKNAFHLVSVRSVRV